MSVRRIGGRRVARDDLRDGLAFAFNADDPAGLIETYLPRTPVRVVSTADGMTAIANGPSGPGYVLSATGSRFVKGVNGNTAANAALVDIPANASWTVQVVIDGYGSTGANPGFFRSGTAANGTTFLLDNGGARRPWIRVAGTNVLNPTTGAQWTAGGALNLICRFVNGASVSVWFAKDRQHHATHAVSQDAASIWLMGQQSGTDYVTGNMVLSRMWLRALPDMTIKELAAEPDSYYARRICFLLSSTGNVYSVSVSESASATDAVSTTLAAAALITEAGTATDAASATMVRAGSVSELASASDAVVAALSAVASVSESATATDSASALGVLAASISESATVGDLVSAINAVAAAITEAANATDQASTGPVVTAELSEAVTATDAVAAVALLVAQVTEAATAGDASSAAMSLVALLTEAATATDAVSSSLAGGGGTTYNVSLTEAAEALDVLTSALRRAGVLSAAPYYPMSGGGRPASVSGTRPANLNGRTR